MSPHEPPPAPDDLIERLRRRLEGTLVVDRELGGGGMSRVFVARDPALDREVVVKVLHGAGHVGSLERFRREMMLSASLQHPHIVPVLAAGDVDGVPWYSMPYIEGRSLGDRLAAGTLPSVREAVRILRDVARALSHAHERGIVHRDLKPDNVLLTGDAAMIIDFGIAKALQEANTQATGETAALTRVGFTVGTPTYMAPEQAASDPALDHRADLYAFGVLAYELLAGEPPFTAKSTHELLVAHMTRPAPSLDGRREDLPDGLVKLVSRCLAKAPADRPASAAELVDALEGVASATTGEVPAIPGRRAWFAAAAAVLVTVIVAGVAARRDAPVDPVPSAATAAPSVAVLPFVPRGDDSASSWLAIGLSDDIAAQLLATGAVQVAPRLAVERLGRAPLTPAEVAETLGVRTLLDGVVRREGEELRVIAQLVDAQSGDVLWTGSYRQTVAAMGSVIDDVVGSVARALAPRDSAATAPRLGARADQDPLAYAGYLRALALLRERSDTAIVAAVTRLREVVADAPTFASAQAALADGLLLLPLYAGVPFAAVEADAEAAIAQALEASPGLPAALAARGRLAAARWEWSEAERDFTAALATAEDAEIARALGEVQLVTGRPALARSTFATARRLAPSVAITVALEGVAAALSDTVGAGALLRDAVVLDTTSGPTRFLAGAGWLILGSSQRALGELEVASRLAPNQPLLMGLRAQAMARAGDAAGATRLRNQLAADAERAGVAGGLVHAELAVGDTAAALAALERALSERDPVFASEPLDTPLMDPIRRTPRFRAVLAQVGVAGPSSPGRPSS
ncbi:MAG TPA: protein kinase [Gemmatimonadales bacterium]|nr:protein kinase [Gemmatimonadales bacterium]